MWTLLGLLALGIVFRLFVVNININRGISMMPTYLDGDVIVSNKLIYFLRRPKDFEAVMLKDPQGKKKYLHKRIIKQVSGFYYVLGDNLDNSRDSREFGLVDKKNIKARTELILFSIDMKKKRIRWNRTLKRAKR